jgi:hypothetical protein
MGRGPQEGFSRCEVISGQAGVTYLSPAPFRARAA